MMPAVGFSAGAESRRSSVIAAIVGIDGCGKSSTFRGATDVLARSLRTVGIGEVVLDGRPAQPVRQRTDIPLSRSARVVGLAAKGLRRPGLYRDLKLLEFTERNFVRSYVVAHDAPDAVLTDGHPLVNIAAWAVARYSREELVDDDRLVDVLHYLAGARHVPLGELWHDIRVSWQLTLLSTLRLARFGFPDVVVLLRIDPATAMQRIRDRGRPLQAHETEAFLAELAAAYERVCRLLEERCGVRVVRIDVGDARPEDVVLAVADAVRSAVAAAAPEPLSPDTIEVVATTMSGSFADQRKVGHIATAFRAVTERAVRVHQAASHAAAEAIAHDIVVGGGRTIVSAGGAGTFNAVLEGCHVDGRIPPDLRLAFLRKGSADLIGKVLHVPDELPAAAAAIAGGIDAERDVPADVLAVETSEPDGTSRRRHMVGFGGFGVFGDIPRFTESRVLKFYKGLLGTLFGDLGPFYVGLLLAAVRWSLLRLFGRVDATAIVLDGESLPAERWGAVIVLNGDLGKDFPLGRGLPLAGGAFRVVILRYAGVRAAVRQIQGCRTAALLDQPDEHDAIVRDVRSLEVRPAAAARRVMVNVDGLQLMTRGRVEVAVSGRVRLVDAGRAAETSVAVADASPSWRRS